MHVCTIAPKVRPMIRGADMFCVNAPRQSEKESRFSLGKGPLLGGSIRLQGQEHACFPFLGNDSAACTWNHTGQWASHTYSSQLGQLEKRKEFTGVENT